MTEHVLLIDYASGFRFNIIFIFTVLLAFGVGGEKGKLQVYHSI